MIKSNLIKCLSVLAAMAACLTLHADTTELLWQIVPGGTVDRPAPWLGTGNNERGIAYNPVTKHVLVVSRQGGLSVRILDAETGNDITVEGDPLTAKVLDVTGVSGGTFALSTIGVTDDGVIYAANLTTGSVGSPFKVYRWANEDSAPTIAFSGDPSEGVAGAVRYGDTFFVRGSGVNAQLMAGARATAHVAIFTTLDGENFSSKLIAGAGGGSGSLGVAFGNGNTGWSAISGTLRHFSFDLAAGTSSLIESITLPTSTAPIGTDPTGKYLGALTTTTPPVARVYDVSAGGAIVVGNQTFTAPGAANANGIGAVDIGDNKAFFMAPNNGVVALKIVVSVTPVTIQTPPATNLTVIESGKITVSVGAQGTPPLTYQWSHAGTNLPGATSSSLIITNASADHAGEYTVTVSNAAGPVTSDPGMLTVVPLVRGTQMTLKWKINAGDPTRPWFAEDNNTRGVAFNPVTGHVLVVTRTPSLTVHILNAQTGAAVMNGDQPATLPVPNSIITGGTFTLDRIGVATDGVIYGANLTTGAGTTAYKVYRWDNETAEPYPVYAGDPSGSARDLDKRFGDSFDVRGSAETTEILAGSRNGNVVALIKPNADISLTTAYGIVVADAPDGAFGLSVAFGEGNSFFGTATANALRLVNYDAPVEGNAQTTGTIARTFTAAEVPFSVASISYLPSADFLAGIAQETPDNVRLYKINSGDAAPDLLDQELFDLDAANGNGTGSVDFGGNMLFALDTNNGLLAFDVSTTVAPVGATLAAVTRASNGTVTLSVSGTIGATYELQATNDLSGTPQWTKVTDVTIGASGTETATDANAAGQGMRFYRAISR